MKTIKAAVMAALVAAGVAFSGAQEANAQGFSLSFGRGGFYAGPSYGYGYGGYGGYGGLYGSSYGYPSYGYSSYGYAPRYYGNYYGGFGRRNYINRGYGFYGGGRHFRHRGFDWDD